MGQELGNTIEQRLELRDDMVVTLRSGSRRERQEAAHTLAQLAQQDVHLVAEIADDLVTALAFSEAQTRWECLNALSSVALVDPELTVGAFEGAEESLFDEGSAEVRLSAFRYLCRYGTTTKERSQEVWPLVREAVQCYHGDPEYREMLMSLLEYAHGNLADDVRKDLVKRMQFDAKNGTRQARRLSNEICAVAKGV